MKKLFIATIIAAGLVHFTPKLAAQAEASYCAEFYKDNLFLGLAYHRIACLTNWTTIQSSQDYDGFTYTRYCNSGTTSDYVPGAEWFDYACFASTVTLSSAQYSMDYYGTDTNTCYATPNYQDRSNVCSYNILTDCNSDCWIANFSKRLRGTSVSIASPCGGSPPVATVHNISCNI